jgi:hypothetical protein
MIFHRPLIEFSGEIASLIEHSLIPEIVTECWDRGMDVDVLHADLDSGGYDLVLEAGAAKATTPFVIRHIQFKASYKKAGPRSVHVNIERRVGGCIVWIVWDRQPGGPIHVKRLLFFGDAPGKPTKSIPGRYVKKPRGGGLRVATKRHSPPCSPGEQSCWDSRRGRRAAAESLD